jgi:hypothetical protein
MAFDIKRSENKSMAIDRVILINYALRKDEVGCLVGRLSTPTLIDWQIQGKVHAGGIH